jgi:3-oxoacyl-[acyl-carrier protein] reductase
MSELDGKVAIVTGASRGIGAATAWELSRQGVAVVLAARSAGDIERIAGEIRAGAGKAIAVTCDVSRFEDLQNVVGRGVAEFGRLDILVNNAGVIEPIARLDESDPASWGQALDINVKGVYHGIRAAIPEMLGQDGGIQDGGIQAGGVIVNISSGAAVSALEGWSHYCAGKAAVLMLTRCVQKEYGAQGIRAVGLSPGTVATEMQVVIKASGVNPVSQLDPSVHIPADWPARAIAWLCTEAAAEFAGDDVRLGDENIRRRIGLID